MQGNILTHRTINNNQRTVLGINAKYNPNKGQQGEQNICDTIHKSLLLLTNRPIISIISIKK